VTNKNFDIPLKPSTFAMTLRKYLVNGRLTDFIQYEFDRIIELKIRKKEGEYTLVIEFFSNGNIIIIDPDGKIILPLIRQSWKHRKIIGRELYIPPPSQINPFDLTKERFIKLLKESSSDIVRTLAVNFNLSGVIAEEVCFRANIDKKTKIEDIDEETLTRVYDSYIDFIDIFKGKKFKPVIVKKNGLLVDILPFRFKSYKNIDFEKVDSLSRGLEAFIEVKKVEKKEAGKVRNLIGKLQRQLTQQKETIEKFEKQIKSKKLEGDLIYLNYQDIDKLLEEINQVLDLKDKDDSVEKINEKEIVKVFDPIDNLLMMKLKDTSGKSFEITINFRKTASENAEKAYDDYKKLRSKLRGAKRSMVKTEEQINKAKKKEGLEKEKEKKIEKKEKLYWFERFRWFISTDGNIVIAGKDAKTNEIVVKKYLKEGDRYAHADIHGAPSCIIKNIGVHNENVPISEQTIKQACIFAASYSKAWKQFADAQVYWVLPEQVSKTPQSGEFVPKGAFIIRGKRNYLKCELKIVIGEIKINHERKIIGGPIDAIKKRADRYVILTPGDLKKNIFSLKLAKALDVPVDRIDRILPPGGVNIVKTVGLDLK
jgi:predicted ribosome quality control (RQC) complex YloA/Tae2 family protein